MALFVSFDQARIRMATARCGQSLRVLYNNVYMDIYLYIVGIYIYICTPRTHLISVLIGKDHVLDPKQGSIRF